jgi:hypothetical protein
LVNSRTKLHELKAIREFIFELTLKDHIIDDSK